MPRIRNATTHHPLPIKGGDNNAFDPNWNALERSFNQILPICVTAMGSPGRVTSSSPGPPAYITWQPPSNPLYDVSNIVGPTPTQNLRIPQDGFYDFWYQIGLTTATTVSGGDFALHCFLETAVTSDSGFTSPTWTRLIDGPSKFFKNDVVALYGDNSMQVIYRGIEMHANDLFRMGLNTFVDITGPAVADLQNIVVQLSEFRLVYPIPNQQVLQP